MSRPALALLGCLAVASLTLLALSLRGPEKKPQGIQPDRKPDEGKVGVGGRQTGSQQAGRPGETGKFSAQTGPAKPQRALRFEDLPAEVQKLWHEYVKEQWIQPQHAKVAKALAELEAFAAQAKAGTLDGQRLSEWNQVVNWDSVSAHVRRDRMLQVRLVKLLVDVGHTDVGGMILGMLRRSDDDWMFNVFSSFLRNPATDPGLRAGITGSLSRFKQPAARSLVIEMLRRHLDDERLADAVSHGALQTHSFSEQQLGEVFALFASADPGVRRKLIRGLAMRRDAPTGKFLDGLALEEYTEQLDLLFFAARKNGTPALADRIKQRLADGRLPEAVQHRLMWEVARGTPQDIADGLSAVMQGHSTELQLAFLGGLDYTKRLAPGSAERRVVEAELLRLAFGSGSRHPPEVRGAAATSLSKDAVHKNVERLLDLVLTTPEGVIARDVLYALHLTGDIGQMKPDSVYTSRLIERMRTAAPEDVRQELARHLVRFAENSETPKRIAGHDVLRLLDELSQRPGLADDAKQVYAQFKQRVRQAVKKNEEWERIQRENR